MPRRPRQKSESGFYHVMQRGIDKNLIFEEQEDYRQFLMYLERVKCISGFLLFGYCLMPNHFHLLLKEEGEPVQQVFRRLSTRYVGWFNAKYERTGHLFQNRFLSKPVESDESFLKVLTYIHNNPVKAGICAQPTDYSWCSRRLLGRSEGITDDNELFEKIPFETIVAYETGMSDEDTYSPFESQKPLLIDQRAAELLKTASGITYTSEFLALKRDEQSRAIKILRDRNASIRQIARVSGLSKGVVERMCHQS